MRETDFPEFAYELPMEIGELKTVQKESDGVYYICTIREGLPAEYYLVSEEAKGLSETAKKYGKAVEYGFLIYDLNDPESGHYIIDYEITRERVRRHLAKEQELLECAYYAMEYHEDYFGQIPVPTQTPLGHTTRSIQLIPGVEWLETDEGKETLSIFFPIWEGDLSQYTKLLALHNPEDHDVQANCGFSFYKKEDAALPLLELWRTTDRIHPKLNKEGLANAVWAFHPEYAAAWNLREQIGANDISGRFLKDLGIGEAVKDQPQDMLKITKREIKQAPSETK